MAGCRPLIVTALFIGATIAGCDSKPGGRLPIQGRVLLDGEPLAFGSIIFIPDGRGPKTASLVENGDYYIPAARGPLAGGMAVQIRAPQLPAGESVPEDSAARQHLLDSSPELLPARYNTKSELRATVTDSGPNQFNFELTSR